MADVSKEQVVDFLSKMSVLDLAALTKELEDKWGVKAAPVAVAAAPGAGAAAAAPAAEQTEFTIVLTDAGANKIGVIKGGYVDGKALDVKGVVALSNLPGKDELRATFLATLLAVPQNFVRLTIAAQQNFAFLLASRERALSEGGSEQK